MFLGWLRWDVARGFIDHVHLHLVRSNTVNYIVVLNVC